MHRLSEAQLKAAIEANVSVALEEDIANGDVSAALIPADAEVSAQVITRQPAVICGVQWVNEVFRQLDSRVSIEWKVEDGSRIEPDQVLCHLHGPARALLSGERSALNFLQLLSAMATKARYFHDLVAGTGVKLLDTRKTIPGLRIASKYAVRCGCCENHRIGLFDAFLLKENHIAASGSISAAVNAARTLAPDLPLEVEVETLDELLQALDAAVPLIMLDNFSLDQMREAVALTAGRARLEASGGVTESTLRQIAETGVDYISLGTLTKDVTAIDLSMRVKV